ncbi:hypothetical protein [Rhodoligotrophos ferricapiens]|uniref:hypothetical protein n=1 Tax=Rhodoligotrophos ferricapiens TaxID=3069264 RepID=UPI00315D8714
MRRHRHIGTIAGILLASGTLGAAALAQAPQQSAETQRADAKDASLDIELNRLEQRDNACRLSFVYRNRLGADLANLQLEAVLFDKDERVERFLVLSSKALPAEKIRVQQFDIAGLDCKGLGSVLVNDVKACEGEGLEPAKCLAELALSSKTDTKLLSSVDQ